MLELYKIKICPHCKTNVTNMLKDDKFSSLLDYTCLQCGKTFGKSKYEWDEMPRLHNKYEIRRDSMIEITGNVVHPAMEMRQKK